jgi:phospholipase D1/2
LVQEGRNAWRLANAERLAFLVDGEEYFAALAETLSRARRSVLIAAWEIDDRASLEPRKGESGRLGELLRERLRQRRDLHVHVLAWDFAMIYAVERGLQPLFRLRFSTGWRLHLKLDHHHPVGASHHQKLVVVDDRVAFLGGLDIAEHRWDRRAHQADDPGRVDDSGEPYPPFHDVQVAVQGPAAAAAGELFRERWRVATGKRLKPPDRTEESPWPETLVPDAQQVTVALCRTRPAYREQAEVREVERLHLDAIAAARRSIYIENQYLTSIAVVRALCERLREPDGPEVMIVLPRRCPGWLEERTVGLLRRRRLQELNQVAGADRLRVLYPHVAGVEGGVYVHAKVMVVDETLARVGSANLSNRSMGFDTELDLALAAEGNGAVSGTIAGFRNRLLAEHLGRDAEAVARAIEESGGSLVAAVDGLRSDAGRSLRPVQDPPLEPGWEPVIDLGRDLADPESADRPERVVADFIARDVPRATRSPWLRAAAVAVILTALLIWWRGPSVGALLSGERLTSVAAALRDLAWAPLGVAAAYVVGSLLLVPVTLLIAATPLVFGPFVGTAYAFAGILGGSSATFLLGRLVERDAVGKLAGRRLNDLSRRLARGGVLAVAAVRLIPAAPFTLVNAVAGAMRVSLRDFLLGTLLGMAPGVVAIVLLETTFEWVVRRPGLGSGLALWVVATATVLLFALLRRLGIRSGE